MNLIPFELGALLVIIALECIKELIKGHPKVQSVIMAIQFVVAIGGFFVCCWSFIMEVK